MASENRKRRNNPAAVREKLLDSAEALFAEHGFDGVSVREIVAHAGLRISSLTYHFDSKAELFEQVIARRSKEYVSVLETSLDRALAESEGRPTAETIVRAYLAPYFDLAQNRGEGWSNYNELVGRSMNMRQNAEVLAPLWREMYPAQKRLLAAFGSVNPNASLEDLNWSVHFIVAAAIHILLQTSGVDHQSDGLCRGRDLPHILEKVVPFLAAGFERLTAGTGEARQQPAADAERTPPAPSPKPVRPPARRRSPTSLRR